ncbi:polysaccharide deacetylase family protein [Evansella clarkii]|uniref:polysaccharide deacetylase family protein n=1 Tax=Evansella clarkii TaxID=79879 RepID=UPI00099605DC|nr:polysaccharide deacetylase family protein [Evansella clarkii]
MKRIITLSLLSALALVSAGCAQEEAMNENNETEEGEETELNNNEDNSEVPVSDEGNDENNEVNNEVNDEQAANESEEENNNAAEEAYQPEEPLYEVAGAESNFIVRPIEGSGADEEVVLLTIDDSFLSANFQYALEMAEILQEHDANAIFFINGQLLSSEEEQDRLRELHEMGAEIGNHTMHHHNLSELSEEEQREEIVQLNDIIEEVTGERPRFFRAPYGVNPEYTQQVVEEEGMQWMNWTYGYDWEPDYLEAEPLAEIMVETPLLGNGANLLIHDREHTKDALADIITGLRDKGYEIVDPALIK